MGLEELLGRRALEAAFGAHRTFVGQVTTANTDGSYDVAVFELGVILPRLFRSAVEVSRLAPGDYATIRAIGAALELL